LEVEEKVFGEWSSLDHVHIVELLAERRFSLRQFSEQLREQIDDWGERSSEKSALYDEWVRGAKEHSKAAELFGSLQLPLETRTTDTDEWCRRKAYLGVLRAIILPPTLQGTGPRGNLTALESRISGRH
jgi:hypothetical protein